MVLLLVLVVVVVAGGGGGGRGGGGGPGLRDPGAFGRSADSLRVWLTHGLKLTIQGLE